MIFLMLLLVGPVPPGQSVNERPLGRRDVVDALVRTSPATELRFQGVNLLGADLSKLDLRNINFKVSQNPVQNPVKPSAAHCNPRNS